MTNIENMPLPRQQTEHLDDPASASPSIPIDDIYERAKNFKYDPSISEEIGRQQRELKTRKEAERAERLNSFGEKLGIQRNVIGAVLNQSFDFESPGRPPENTTHSPSTSLIDSVIGSNTSEQARVDAQSALDVIQEELKFAGGDHETARKEIMRRYHPDVDESEMSAVIPWVNKLWDSESKQFKL